MQPSRIHLFQGYGIELEYMIVNRDTLQVEPIADELLRHELGVYGSDFKNGLVTWSNELVLHVVELKSTKPEINFNAIENSFAENIKRINAILASWNVMLMPTAAHPFMNPEKETKLWPHESNQVYDLYNKIFDCSGHGWSNVQSTHLNLPFYDDEEFAKLHAATRLVLPLLPAICASSPILEGRLTGALDTRLRYYKTNQAKIPSITGKVIPEAVFSKRNYSSVIYDKIKKDVQPYDADQLLNPTWVNSRGAIARFDRGSIEIRLMDVQECPAADMAIITLVIETIKALVNESFIDHDAQMKVKTEMLSGLLDQVIESGQAVVISNRDFLDIFRLHNASYTAREVWLAILNALVSAGNSALHKWRPELDVIFSEGTLAQRIVKALGSDPDHEQILSVYKNLSGCLAQNRMFIA